MSTTFYMSDDYKPFFQKLSVQGKGRDELSYSFSSEEIEQENSSVYLFGIFSLASSAEIYQFFIRQCVKHFLDFYHRIPRVAMPDDTTSVNTREFLFENAIQYVYENITSALMEFHESRSSRSSKIDIKKVQCILGCYSDGHIYLNITGLQLLGYYIYPRVSKQSPLRYALTSIIENRDDDTSPRLFSSMISGTVSVRGGTVVFCTPSLLDYLSMDQLKQMISSQRSDTLQLSLDRMFSKVSSRNDITALFLLPYYDGPWSNQSAVQTASNTSMEELRLRQQGTDNVLTPAMSTSFKKALLSLAHAFQTTSRSLIKLERHLMQPATWNKILRLYHFVKKQTYRLLSSSLALLHEYRLKKRVAVSEHIHIQSPCETTNQTPIALVTNEPSMILRLKNVQHLFNSILTVVVNSIIIVVGRVKKVFLSLSISSRSLLVLSALFLILFVYSLFALQTQHSTKAADRTINETLNRLEQMMGVAEASLIYQNTDDTLRLINDIEQVMNSLPTARTEKQITAIQERRILIEALKARAFHITVIQEPRLIATLADSGDSEYRLETNEALAVIANSQHIALLDLTSNAISDFTNTTLLPSPGAVTLIDQTSALIASREGTDLFILDAVNKIKQIPIQKNATERELTAIAIYNGNLYVFDRQSGSLYKHGRAGNGFASGAPWITQTTVDIKSALDIDIDGAIYVLNPTNQLYRYSRGRPSPIPFPLFQPPLQTISRIETNQDSKRLFFAEPRSSRIFALDKDTFALAGQITSPAFDALSDIALEPKTGDLLVISGNRIYRIESSLFK